MTKEGAHPYHRLSWDLGLILKRYERKTGGQLNPLISETIRESRHLLWACAVDGIQSPEIALTVADYILRIERRWPGPHDFPESIRLLPWMLRVICYRLILLAHEGVVEWRD